MSLTNEIETEDFIKYFNKDHKKLIIAGHGLAGGAVNIFNFAAINHIVKNNLDYDYIALKLHTAKSFLQTSVIDQARLISKVINDHVELYDEIHLIGLSYSALSCLESDLTKVTSLSLIAPSLNVHATWCLDQSKRISIDGNTLYLNFESTVPRAFNQYLKIDGLGYDEIKAMELLGLLGVKTLVINGKDDYYYSFFKDLQFDNFLVEWHVFDDMTHCLQKLGVMDRVLDKTFSFIMK